MGFLFERGCYLRDGWNILDFFVVLTSILSIAQVKFGDVDIGSIRTLRMLKALRNVNSIKGLRNIIITLIEALPDLGNVVVFLLFIIILFAILGVQLFGDAYEWRCKLTPEPVDG